MKNKYRFTAVLLFTIAVCAYFLTSIYVKSQTKEEDDRLTVVTSFYPVYIAAANVVGDCKRVEVKNLSEPQTGCLHDFQLTPEDMKLLSGADVFVVNGGGMEAFLTDVLKQYPNLNIVETMETQAAEDADAHEDAEAHIHTEENADVHTHTHAEEDSDTHTHTHENAHAWMSVEHYRGQVEVITDALCEAFLEYADIFRENAAAYDAKLAKLQAQQEEIYEAAAGTKIISFHEAYEYVAEDYGLEICYTLNLDEERQVSAGEVADVLRAVRENGISMIFAEELYGSELSETVRKEADVEVYYLDSLVRGDYSLDSYINGMQENINILKAAFGVN